MENGKPDKLDVQIIKLLRDNGRRSTKEIAGKLRVTEATITSRISALNKAGVMRVMAQRNLAMQQKRTLCIVSVWVSGRNIEEVARSIAAHPDIATVHLTIGSPEVQFSAFVADNGQVPGFIQNDIGHICGIDRLEVNIVLETRIYRADYASLEVDHHSGDQFGDELDDQIIRQLQHDGRVSNREIGRILDVPASTIRERVNRLLSSKAIRIGAVCDPQKFGLNRAALAFLQVLPAKTEEALAHLEYLEDMGQVSVISGSFSIYVLFGARDFDHVISIVQNKLEVTPGLRDISVRMISATHKHRADLINVIRNGE